MFRHGDQRHEFRVEASPLQFDLAETSVELGVGQPVQPLDQLVEHGFMILEHMFDHNSLTRFDVVSPVRSEGRYERGRGAPCALTSGTLAGVGRGQAARLRCRGIGGSRAPDEATEGSRSFPDPTSRTVGGVREHVRRRVEASVHRVTAATGGSRGRGSRA
jgi:hypothetical protein